MATTHVSSVSELKAALASAKGGDTILVKSGSYDWVTLGVCQRSCPASSCCVFYFEGGVALGV